MIFLRLILIRTMVGVVCLFPLRWFSRRLKPGPRARFWRHVALGVMHKHGRPPPTRPVGLTQSGGALDLLLVSDALFPERGGGTRSLMQAARRFMAAGWKVAGVCHGSERRKFNVGGMEVHWIPELGELDNLVSTLPVRRLAIQQIWAPGAAQIARARGVPYWYFVRSTEELMGDIPPASDESQLIAAVRETAAAGGRASQTVLGAQRIIANSKFMARLIRGGLGREAHVLYPEVDEPMPWERRRDPVARCIVAIATTKKKGVDIMIQLARSFPEEQFLLCGLKPLTRYKSRQLTDPTLKNIVAVGRLPTPAAYALAKMVLVPSQWPEPFGRVNAEAVLRGIPVLASRVGGVSEVITDESLLISDFTNAEAWAKRLGELTDRRTLRATRPAIATSAALYATLMEENSALIAELVR